MLVGKPDAGIYRLACEHLAIERGLLLAVEDAVSGIRAAVDAGLRCVGVALHESPRKLMAAGAIHTVPDFRAVSAHGLECMLLGAIQRETADNSKNPETTALIENLASQVKEHPLAPFLP